MSLEKMVDDKVDAYRNNPGALQKNYQMNQDLLDLLALQKIKSEKDAAARQLQMSMQQNPQSIAEQRGKEAIERTKDEVVEQVGGVAKVNQARQQNNMRRAAAGAPPARQQMTGVAGQPAPNMRMQSGGIVNFAQGDPVLSDAQLERLGITRQIYDAMTSDEKAEQAERARIIGLSGSVPIGGTSPALRRRGTVMGRPTIASQRRVDTSTAPPTDAERLAAERDAFKRITAYGTGPASRRTLFTERASGPLGAPFAPKPGSPRAALTGVPAAAAASGFSPRDMEQPSGYVPISVLTSAPPLPDNLPPPGVNPFDPITAPTIQTASRVSEAGIPTADRVSFQRRAEMADIQNQLADQSKFLNTMQQQDPRAMGIQARDDAAKFLNRSGVASQYADMQRRQAALAAQNRRNRSDTRFYDLLSRAGGQGALANIGRATSDARRADRLQDQQDLDRELNIQREGIGKDIDIGKSSLASGDKQKELTSAEKRTAATARTNLLTNRETNLTKEALAVLKADIANIGEVAARRRDLIALRTANMNAEVKENIANLNGQLTTDTNNIRKLTARVASASDAGKALERVNAVMADVRSKVAKQLTTLLSTDAAYMQLQTEDAKNRKDGKPTNNAAKYRAQMQRLYDEIAENAINELKEQRTSLSRRYSELTANLPPSSNLGQTRVISP